MLQSSNHVCPSCKTLGMSIFYEALDVPINSCLMFSTQKAAQSFPRGDVVLGFCKTCGFISNVAFDSSKVDYASLAPEEQGFSATFNTYIQRLAKRLIDTYNIRNRHISEIGCGRGDFLALLCKLGNNRGVGIDPSSVSGDMQESNLTNITFIHDYYSERYAKYLGDFVACRHTLEHIPETSEFLKSVRSAFTHNNAQVFFEVPDVSRILQEIAFWDIYYEHCSYFNLGSLARLFRSCQFEVLNLTKDYFDQYLLIEAKPVLQKSDKTDEKEESLKKTTRLVKAFSEQCQSKLKNWKNTIEQLKSDNKRGIVWGSGSKCVAFMTTLGITDEIEYIVDINPNRHGKFIPGVGKEIVAPDFLKQYKPDTVIVMNPVYCKEIKETLEDMGIVAELIPCN